MQIELLRRLSGFVSRRAKGLCLSLKADQKLRGQAHIRLLLMGDTAESGMDHT